MDGGQISWCSWGAESLVLRDGLLSSSHNAHSSFLTLSPQPNHIPCVLGRCKGFLADSTLHRVCVSCSVSISKLSLATFPFFQTTEKNERGKIEVQLSALWNCCDISLKMGTTVELHLSFSGRVFHCKTRISHETELEFLIG